MIAQTEWEKKRNGWEMGSSPVFKTVLSIVAELGAEESEKRLKCAPELLSILRALATNPHLNIGDLVYAVRDKEGEGWEGPSVKAWSEAVTAAQEMLARFPAELSEEPKRMLVKHREFVSPSGGRWKWDGVTLFSLEELGWKKSIYANIEELESIIGAVAEIA